MAKKSGTNINRTGQYGEEFASETNVQEVKRQNREAAQGFESEFASETDVQEVRKQNQQAEQNKK